MSKEVIEVVKNLEKKMDERFTRHEDLLTQLITMVAETNKRLDRFEIEVKEDVSELDKLKDY
ncbi:hypothetical protein [Bacillus sp. FJAT-45350]|uniref:hypothetical protein n=1 Tax=Bacillus sp. FJAT-45350 TaxID=2011014 RepID=UPI000BB7995F|nr:hypothetical protein [Bacillus sp. FJAT-45350]